MDSITEQMLTQWAKHREEGRAKGIDARHDWEDAPEWAHHEATEWQGQDSAWRRLIGGRMADDAIRAMEGTEQ